MVTIRMYNVGLGDCFLLRFKAPAPNRDRFMLIDCGLILGSVAGEATLRAVAEDIFDTTGGRLDVVVATHEHQDHLSGFWYAQDIFKKIKIDKVWMAWTERPGDEMARRLKDKIEDFSFRLDGVVSKLEDDTLKNPQKFNLRAQSSLKSVRSVLDFLGLDTDDSIPKNGSGNPHNEDEQTPKKKVSMNRKALDYLQKEAVRPENIVYHEPDTTTTLDGLPNIRVYILGPPRSSKIKQSDPNKRNSEVYNFAGNDRSDYAIRIPAWSGDEKEDQKDQLDRLPFESVYYMTAEKARQPIDNHQDNADTKKWKAFFQKRYDNDEQKYRQIDDDWLFSLGNLALQLDGDTNNTSLALAIELIDTKQVLLFPGDAQVGNWLSWHDCTWQTNEDTKDVTTPKLLEQTVFYKVGHHGSHNATLRDKGLELMTSPDLVAMIPLDEAFARNSKGWDMPFGNLFNRLVEKTQGRMIQADGQSPPIPNPRYPSVTNDLAQKTFLDSLKNSDPRKRPNTEIPLWTEFVIPKTTHKP